MGSFVAQGYQPIVWTYGDLPNLSAGATARDAREVLPESAVFVDKAELLTAIVRIHATHGFLLQPPAFANPIPHWECPARLLAPDAAMPEGTAFLHCYNETWREAKIDKDAPFPKGSLMASLAERYL